MAEGGPKEEKGREKERELPLIGRMIPANPEKLEWREGVQRRFVRN